MKVIQCEWDRLRVLLDGVHVSTQNPQPIQPYHGLPNGEDARRAYQEIQAWPNPVLNFLIALPTGLQK